MNGSFSRPERGCLFAAALLISCLVWPGIGAAGPLHDPFVEQFQVGTWSDPQDVRLQEGYPAGLLTPVRLDTLWTDAARLVLTANDSTARRGLTRRFLRHLRPAGADSVWLHAARTALEDLIAGRLGAPDVPFLRPERLARAFDTAVARADHAAAIAHAETLFDEAATLGLPAREVLVWDLRRRLVRQRARQPLANDDRLWPTMVELGPFDTVNAWALWVACRRGAGRPVLPPAGDQKALGQVLSRLSAGQVTPQELYGSRLPADWQAGLGAILLKKNQLSAHFKKFPEPPTPFSLQGWWVRGQRRLRDGHPGSYERLAARVDLKPGWRMDVLRRASELRLLKGAWPEGLEDMQQALALAQRGNGTAGQRKRLRQWAEQAMVLALAKSDLATARRIRDWGLEDFRGQERETFAREIRQWTPRLDRSGKELVPLSSDIVDRARLVVETGAASEIRPVSATQRAAFQAAADRELWETWYKWGLTLANPLRVSGDRRIRAYAYREALLAGLKADNNAALADSALAVVALRLGDRPWLAELLRTLVDGDAGSLCAWQSPPRPSPVPNLLPQVRGSELDRHALLGFCLATGDMRGIVGLAFELPGRGLTRDEKRLFLYPLPVAGPIREAIEAADNEPALLLAVARNESLFEPAVRSRAGALGWMQIMPFHYPRKGALFGPGNWRLPAMSVSRGNGLLTENRRRYGGDPYRILAAYNAGPEAVARWDKQLGGQSERDIYLAWIGYPETRAYVEKVLIDREVYHAIIGALPTPSPSAPPNE